MSVEAWHSRRYSTRAGYPTARAALGVGFGTMIGNVGLGIALGAAFGLVFGSALALKKKA